MSVCKPRGLKHQCAAVMGVCLYVVYMSHVTCKTSGAGMSLRYHWRSKQTFPQQGALSFTCLTVAHFLASNVHSTVLVQERESDGEPGVWVNVWHAMPLGSVQCELKCSTVTHQCLGPPDSKCFGEWTLRDHDKALGFTKWSSALGQVGTLMLIPNLCLSLKDSWNETGFLHRVNSGFALKSEKTMFTF